MGKFTFWITLAGLVWLGWTLWRVGQRRAHANERERAGEAAQAPEPVEPPGSAEPEPMVSCQHCQLYLPKREAVETQGAYFCSTAHRDESVRARGNRH